MLVKKRKGHLEQFDPQKIMTTISRVSDECDQPMNEADLKMNVHDVTRVLEEKYPDEVSAARIMDEVVETLNKNGFSFIAKAYCSGKKK